MIDRYLYIGKGAVFPCDDSELKLTLNYQKPNILEKWPQHGHGPEYRSGDEEGVLIIDLLNPSKLMTVEQLKEEGFLE